MSMIKKVHRPKIYSSSISGFLAHFIMANFFAEKKKSFFVCALLPIFLYSGRLRRVKISLHLMILHSP